MSLIATRVQDWIIDNPEFDKNMTRPLEYGALDFFVEQTERNNGILTPETIKRARESIGTTLKFPVINYDANVSIGNVRSCTIADSENTSALYTVVFTTYTFGFTMLKYLDHNNYISYRHDFNRKMEKYVRQLGIVLDQGAIAALTTNKTQVFRDDLGYTITGNVVDASWNQRTEILGDINPMMRANSYPGQLHVIGNIGVESLVRKLSQKDLYNDTNKRNEWADKIFHFSNQITNESGKYASGFAVESGNVSILTRHDRESLYGARSGVHEWDIVRLPIVNIPVSTHYYESVGDYSTTAGAATADQICSIKEYFGFSVDVAYVVAYNSNPDIVPNPIIQFQIEHGTGVGSPVYITNDAESPIPTTTTP